MALSVIRELYAPICLNAQRLYVLGVLKKEKCSREDITTLKFWQEHHAGELLELPVI